MLSLAGHGCREKWCRKKCLILWLLQGKLSSLRSICRYVSVPPYYQTCLSSNLLVSEASGGLGGSMGLLESKT